MGLARNKLSGDDYAQVTGAVHGLDKLSGLSALSVLAGGSASDAPGLAGTLGNVQSMADVTKAFESLGMGGDMVGKFVPVVLKYLGEQGAGGSALQNLGSLWGVEG